MTIQKHKLLSPFLQKKSRNNKTIKSQFLITILYTPLLFSLSLSSVLAHTTPVPSAETEKHPDKTLPLQKDNSSNKDPNHIPFEPFSGNTRELLQKDPNKSNSNKKTGTKAKLSPEKIIFLPVIKLMQGIDSSMQPIHCKSEKTWYGTKFKPDTPFIETNRPDVTDSPVTVPAGYLIVENGALLSRDPDKAGSFDMSETQFRLGVRRRVELTFDMPNWIKVFPTKRPPFEANPDLFASFAPSPAVDAAVDAAAASAEGGDASASATQEDAPVSEPAEPPTPGENRRPSGWQDIAIGAKYQIGPLKALDLAIWPSMSIPTGNRLFTSRHVEPGVRIPWGIEINENWGIGGQNFFNLQYNDAGKRIFLWEPALVLERAFGERGHMFVEYAGDFFTKAKDSQIMHFGGVYRLARGQQLDAHAAVGLTRDSPSFFIGGGYSFMLGKWWGGE